MTFRDAMNAIQSIPGLPVTVDSRDAAREAIQWESALRGVADRLLQQVKDFTKASGAVDTGQPGCYYGWRPQEVRKAPAVDVIMCACKAHRIPPESVLKVDTAKACKHEELAGLFESSWRKTFGFFEIEQSPAIADTTQPGALDVPY